MKYVADAELQILDSQIKRQLDWEITADSEPNPETEFRLWELDAEFASRSAASNTANGRVNL